MHRFFILHKYTSFLHGCAVTLQFVSINMDFVSFIASLQGEDSINLPKTDREVFEMYFKQINKQRIAKSMHSKPIRNGKAIAKAEVNRAEGNGFYMQKKYGKALDKYNLSLSAAPRLSPQYGYALANRSAVLFDLHMYKDCLLDIQNILNSAYPKSYYYKLYLRQAKCYLNLRAFADATTSIEKARRTFRDYNTILPKHFNVLVSIVQVQEQIRLKSKSSVNEDVKEEEDYVLPKLKNGENPKFIGASNAVELHENGPHGRYVTASCDIKKGDVLFIEEAYSFTVLNIHARTINYCNNCLKCSLACLPCSTCSKFFYCSETCRTESWDNDHKWICPGEIKNILSDEMSLVLRVVFRASRNGFKNVVTDETTFGNSEDNYPYLNTLKATHDEDLHERVWVAIILVVYLSNETDYFQWLYEHQSPPVQTNEALVLCVGTYILRHLIQCKFNISLISDIHASAKKEEPSIISLSYDILAIGLYVSTSLINHSCMPNAEACYENNVKWIKAIENIKKGTEITVSYIIDNIVHTNKSDRHTQLKRTFGFLCTCSECTTSDYKNLLLAWNCTKCHGPALTCIDNQCAKCKHCSHEFGIKEHLKLEKTLFYIYIRYENGIQNDFRSLKEMQRIVELIYWEQNFLVFHIQALLVNYHRVNGNLSQCCEYYKLLLQKECMEINERAFIGDWVKCSYVMSKYCKSLQDKESKEYCDTYKETMALINYVGKLLHNYTSQKSVTSYYRDITKYIHSNEPLQFDYRFGEPLRIEP